MKTTFIPTHFKKSLLVLAIAQISALSALADVTPPMVDTSAAPGSSVNVAKSVTTPELPPVLDFCLMVDLSGSYGNDIGNIRALAPGLFDDINAGVADSRFCVNSFVDFPISPWGSPFSGDYAYQLDQDLTTDKTTWTDAIDNLVVRFGSDGPESQYEALYQAATGAGRDVPPPGPSGADVAPDQDPSWRSNATKVVAITTDAPFHNAGDSGPFPYPGASAADTTAALVDNGIRVIAIKAPGSTSQMDAVAFATGGAVVNTSNTSAEIADAVLEGLGNLPVTVTPVPVGCAPLGVSFFPPDATVTSGDTAGFNEVIDVPLDAPQGQSIHCSVDFQDNEGNSLGTQAIWIYVDDVTPPQSACIAGVNPAGNEPKAGIKSTGQNEDGFYELFASDNVDEDPDIFVTDLGSGTVFGPYASGTNIKYTQAPGAQPSAKPGSGEVDWKIKGTGDFTVSAVDEAGNESAAASCLVPPLPK